MSIIREQREWQLNESERQRKWEEAQAALADTRHRDSMAIAVSGNKGNVWSNIAGGVIAVIGALVVWYLGWTMGSQSQNKAMPSKPEMTAPANMPQPSLSPQ